MIVLFPYLKWLHILGAIIGLGASFTYPLWLKLARRQPANTRFIVNGIESVEKVANLGYVTVLITGIAMMLVAGIPFTTSWLLTALILFVSIGIVVGVLYVPAQKNQAALADNPQSPEYLAAEERVTRILVAVILLVIVIEFLMTVKPRLW